MSDLPKLLGKKTILEKKKVFLHYYKKRKIPQMLTALDSIFSYFYTKKVEIKRKYFFGWKKKKEYIALHKEFKEYEDLLRQVEHAFVLIENYELRKKKQFLNVEGEEIVKKVKAKYLHSKRFFE